MEDVITTAQAAGRIAAVLLGDEMEQRFSLGGYEITARRARAKLEQMLLDAGLVAPPEPPPPASETQGATVGPTRADDRPFALVIASGQDEFVLVGQGVGVDFASDRVVVELDAVEEGRFESGQWVPGRLLNGDERLFLLPPDELGAVRIRLLGIPASPVM